MRTNSQDHVRLTDSNDKIFKSACIVINNYFVVNSKINFSTSMMLKFPLAHSSHQFQQSLKGITESLDV